MNPGYAIIMISGLAESDETQHSAETRSEARDLALADFTVEYRTQISCCAGISLFEYLGRRLNLICLLFKFRHRYVYDILVEKMRAKVVFDKMNFNFSIGASFTSQQFDF
jgi:hypothetical protein